MGQSPTLLDVLARIAQVAPTDSSVLLLGETGTGKEILAHAIHNTSPRRSAPLVTINCAALPPSLIESELFGHERGAFTGATGAKAGRFELADGGTLFGPTSPAARSSSDGASSECRNARWRR